MTKNVLAGEVNQRQGYQLRGTRDGLLFRFDAMAYLSPRAQEQFVFDAISEKTELLCGLLGEESVVTIEGITLGEAVRLRLERLLCNTTGASIVVQQGGKAKKIISETINYTHHGTVRGGFCLKSDGDLTVLGDVHDGARLEAGGSIVVLGTLSGGAWAGQSGDMSACVAAWKLQPAEIRIAAHRWQRPSFGFVAKNVPEVAKLRDGAIEILQYNTKM